MFVIIAKVNNIPKPVVLNNKFKYELDWTILKCLSLTMQSCINILFIHFIKRDKTDQNCSLDNIVSYNFIPTICVEKGSEDGQKGNLKIQEFLNL